MKQKKIKEHYNDNGVTNYLSFIWNKFTITLWAIVGFAAIWYSFVNTWRTSLGYHFSFLICPYLFDMGYLQGWYSPEKRLDL